MSAHEALIVGRPSGQAHGKGPPLISALPDQLTSDRNHCAGLCFSVRPGVKIPPSLRNIYKEIKEEYPEFEIPKHG